MGKTFSIKVLFGIYLLLMAGKVFAFSCNVDGGSSIGAGTTSVYVNLDPVIQPGQNLVVDLSQHISCWNDYGGWYDTDHINLVQGSAFAGSLQSYKGSLYWNNVTYPFPLTTNTNVLDIGDKTPMPLPLKLYTLSWQQAFDEIGARLQSYSDPNQVEFYTSGRTSNISGYLSALRCPRCYRNGCEDLLPSATHVNEMSNPGRDYPLAMLLLMVAAICLSSVGGLSIAMVIPGNEINLSAGVMQTFTVLMSHVAPEIEWTVRVISALLLLGVLAEIASWIVGPSRGMYVTAQKNLLPAAFAKMNKNGVPVTLVISQLVITSIALIILTNTGGGNNMSFLIALALTVVIYLCAYFMLFIGYIVLVLKHPDLKRTFNIPGGKGVKLVVAIVGLLTSIMAFIVSFLPPDNIQGDSTDMYVELLVVSFLVVLALPFILYAVHDRKSKANTGVTLEPINSQNAPKGHFFLHPRARSPHYIVMNDKKH